MTGVIVIQALVGALAVLLLLENRLRRDEQARAGHGDDDRTAPIAFHPEFIVRWDDEANYHQTSCTRKRATDRAAAIRPQVTVSGSNTHIR